MKRKVFRWFVDYEKEEKWLNSLAAQGWNLVTFTVGLYTFEKGKPGEYIYRIELLENLPSHVESQSYLEFMEESGVDLVDTHLRWVYFRRRATDGPFSLFSDIRSRIKHYQRIAFAMGILALAYIPLSLNVMARAFTEPFTTTRVLTLLNVLFMLIFATKATQYLLKVGKLKKELIVRE